MKRIPVCEVIDQRPVVDKDLPRPSSVFRPLTGDVCHIVLTELRIPPSTMNVNCGLFEQFRGDGRPNLNAHFKVGEADCTVDRGLQAVVVEMRPGEYRDFCVGDGGEGRISGRVCLSSVDKTSRTSWRDDDKLKLTAAARHKDAGNQLYGQGRFADAFHRFNLAARAVLFVRDVDAVRADRDAMYVAVCNNMAACQLRLSNYEHAHQLSDKVLAVEPDNVKALVRRCRASAELRMFDGALADAVRALEIDPGNVVAERYRDVAARGVNVQNARYGDMVKKMFAA
ncbi:peptidyl-prolyl cis-trans isomerase FKBP62-like [Aphis craccivora]|uniref:Peptidyl-prolyl cis-trans isomerase FKBP62-like n=1 Tax=Aphis craccivora TaxID=307492 RepID=A0A6G0ZIU5_APHCR|nr:peptidyl-prolyl cis-trans isomerase FKBP62-like [Aphis craccivora]